MAKMTPAKRKKIPKKNLKKSISDGYFHVHKNLNEIETESPERGL